MTQAEKALRLLELHRAESPLLLINAWDAASARMVEDAGFPAIATSSAGVAYALGHADGQNVAWPEMAAAIQRMARTVQVPVTADIEAGFASTLQELEKTMEQAVVAGAVGVNLEDALPGQGEQAGLYSTAAQTDRIQAARKAGQKQGIHLVVNARTDAYWQKGVPVEEALRNTLERGRAYLQAGADCIFVPGMKDPEHIRAVVKQWNAPVNILATQGAPSVQELAKLGVRRISTGSGPMRAAMGALRRILREVRGSGTYDSMLEGAVPYPEMNALLSR